MRMDYFKKLRETEDEKSYFFYRASEPRLKVKKSILEDGCLTWSSSPCSLDGIGHMCTYMFELYSMANKFPHEVYEIGKQS